eukprot:2864095-Rhodomonas_salina.6
MDHTLTSFPGNAILELFRVCDLPSAQKRAFHKSTGGSLQIIISPPSQELINEAYLMASQHLVDFNSEEHAVDSPAGADKLSDDDHMFDLKACTRASKRKGRRGATSLAKLGSTRKDCDQEYCDIHWLSKPSTTSQEAPGPKPVPGQPMPCVCWGVEICHASGTMVATCAGMAVTVEPGPNLLLVGSISFADPDADLDSVRLYGVHIKFIDNLFNCDRLEWTRDDWHFAKRSVVVRRAAELTVRLGAHYKFTCTRVIDSSFWTNDLALLPLTPTSPRCPFLQMLRWLDPNIEQDWTQFVCVCSLSTSYDALASSAAAAPMASSAHYEQVKALGSAMRD